MDWLVNRETGLGANAKGVVKVLPNKVSDSRTTRAVVWRDSRYLWVVMSVTVHDGTCYAWQMWWGLKWQAVCECVVCEKQVTMQWRPLVLWVGYLILQWGYYLVQHYVIKETDSIYGVQMSDNKAHVGREMVAVGSKKPSMPLRPYIPPALA